MTTDSPSGIPAGRPTDGLEGQLADHLLAAQPSCVVIVGQPPGAGWWRNADDAQVSRVMSFDSLEQCLASELPAESDSATETPQHCVALMQFETDKSPASNDDLAAALGQAVRRFPQRLVISIESSEPDDAAFFAFGFRKLQLADQGSIRLFEYCLSEYKQVPDWLNARYWANPERFGLANDQDFHSEDDEDDEEE